MFACNTNNSNVAIPADEARKSLQRSITNRRASLTDVEMAFLSALLFDKPVDGNETSKDDSFDKDATRATESPRSASGIAEVERLEKAIGVLNNDILFSVPKCGIDSPKLAIPPRVARNPSKLVGLFRAHEDGVCPAKLRRLSRRAPPKPKNALAMPKLDRTNEGAGGEAERSSDCCLGDKSDGGDSVQTDREVRREKKDADSDTAHSSWDDEEGGYEHYDAWEVLRDKYATDFGFDYRQPKKDSEDHAIDDDSQPKIFRILGTSAFDKACTPHVLSPPLMESLLSFVPDALSSDNFWLKYSLVQDGASMDTLKRHARAAENTVLAIETTRGQVFGSFTSSAWRNHRGFYGSGPAFLWRMRHSRRSPCHSLFDQAQMESEIDVFVYTGLNDLLQVCDEDRIALGGGKLVSDTATPEDRFAATDTFDLFHENDRNVGFGIWINQDLVSGTSSPCGTFRNPCLSKHSKEAESFNIANLEIWSFTACYDVRSAEQLEMSKFFMSHSSLDNDSILLHNFFCFIKFCGCFLIAAENNDSFCPIMKYVQEIYAFRIHRFMLLGVSFVEIVLV